MNQIKAAASPIRKRKSMGAVGTGSPADDDVRDKENDGFEITVVGGNVVSPAKRVPILANFEEWMKMATDNVSLGIALPKSDRCSKRIRKLTQTTPGTSP